MRLYVVYDYWVEEDDMPRRQALELQLNDLPGNGVMESVPALVPLADKIAEEYKHRRVIILNAIPLPLIGLAEPGGIIKPSLAMPRGVA